MGREVSHGYITCLRKMRAFCSSNEGPYSVVNWREIILSVSDLIRWLLQKWARGQRPKKWDSLSFQSQKNHTAWSRESHRADHGGVSRSWGSQSHSHKKLNSANSEEEDPKPQRRLQTQMTPWLQPPETRGCKPAEPHQPLTCRNEIINVCCYNHSVCGNLLFSSRKWTQKS